MVSRVFSTNGAVHCKDWDNGPRENQFQRKALKARIKQPGSRLKKRGTEPNPQLLQSRKNFSFGPGQQQGRVEQRAIAVQPDGRTPPHWWLRCDGCNWPAACFHSDRVEYRERYSIRQAALLT